MVMRSGIASLASLVLSLAMPPAFAGESMYAQTADSNSNTPSAAQTVLLSVRADARMVVPLPEDDYDRLREDMRLFLERTTEMLAAAAERDMARVKALADSAQPPLPRVRSLATGMPLPPAQSGKNPHMIGKPPSERDRTRLSRMQRNLPQAYRDMLLQMRQDIEGIARDALSINDPLHTVRQLAGVQATCVACHQIYKHVPVAVDTASQTPVSAGVYR